MPQNIHAQQCLKKPDLTGLNTKDNPNHKVIQVFTGRAKIFPATTSKQTK